MVAPTGPGGGRCCHHHFLVGSIEQITDDVIRRREELGLSNVVFSGGALDDIAPVVSRLAGT